MQFNSIEFLIFLPIVLAVYFVIPKKMRTIWLLLASYYFYMCWNAKYALLIGTSTLITYVSGLLLEKYAGREKAKKAVCAVCTIANLGILAVFKYAGFVMETIDSILSALGFTPTGRRLDLLLPVGISFYTFQAIGYVIDVYREKTKAEKSFIRYALFVSFFPQLVAGPIERSKNLLTQIQNVATFKLWNARRVASGAILIVWGLFLKMVIADRIAILVNNVFANYKMYGTIALMIAAFGFNFQVYCDFSSYSLIAMGSAKMMGFTLMENFTAPLFSKDFKELWSRWHISLTSWFRDYLYFPLGGSRKGKLRKHINMMIIFIVSGLWHGATWGYVLWGTLNGLMLVSHDLTIDFRTRTAEKLNIDTKCFSWTCLKIVVTNALFAATVVFNRSASLTEGLAFFKRMFTKPDPWILFDGGIFRLGLSQHEMVILIASVVLLFLVDLIRYRKDMMIDAWLFTQNVWFEWLFVIVLIVAIYVFGEYGFGFDAKQFVYFQF